MPAGLYIVINLSLNQFKLVVAHFFYACKTRNNSPNGREQKLRHLVIVRRQPARIAVMKGHRKSFSLSSRVEVWKRGHIDESSSSVGMSRRYPAGDSDAAPSLLCGSPAVCGADN